MISRRCQIVASFVCRPTIVLIFLSLWVYGYFYQGGGWNQNTRFDLVRSIVEERTHVVDRYAYNSGDLSERDGHFFCDKAPAVSWIGTVPYAVVSLLTPAKSHDAKFLAFASYLVTVFAISVPSAISVGLLYWLLEIFDLSNYLRMLIVLGYAFGTQAFVYSTLLYGHQLATVFLLAAFSLLARRVPQQNGAGLLFGIGLLLGCSVAADYSSALAVLPICCYAAYKSRKIRPLLFLVLGGLCVAAVLATYHAYYFGSPFKTAYDFSIQSNRHEGGFMGIGSVDFDVLYLILFSGYRGLLYSAPWLAAGVVGWCLLCVNRFLPEALVSLSIVAGFCWLNSSLVDWQGGNAVGPRYLVPIIPFLSIGVAGLKLLPKYNNRIVRAVVSSALVVLVGYSMFMMVVTTSVKPEISMRNPQPYAEILLPSFYQGDLALNTQSIDEKWAHDGPRAAWNLGQLIGLQGLASLLPLGIGVSVLLYWFFHVAAQPAATGSDGRDPLLAGRDM